MIGKQLAHYEITAQLGKGGMGEVYRATDTKLGRAVALKVLPPAFVDDPERIARFEREARTLAALQHTNIASIYGFEAAAGHRFLVMELVEGETLAARLTRGPLAVGAAVGIARQIAQGLEAAHEAGIVHRDLKPANVIIDADDRVKLLDFGLARAYEGESAAGSPEDSPTLTAAFTAPGVILGTAAYMSPEQARGKPLDKRADIWAFGVIVWEMLTGRRLFPGETASDTVAGVLKTAIDLDELPRDCPEALRRLVARCLDRNVATRLRDIGEARIRLDRPLADEEAAAPAGRARRAPLFAIGGVAGLVVGAAMFWILAPVSSDSRPEREIRFSIPRDSQAAPRSALSPDGTKFLYQDGGRLWVREFNALESREVPGTEGALVCNWSPDGEWIVFTGVKTVYKIRPDGSSRTRICEIASDMHDWAGSVAWTEDDRIVFATGDAGLMSVSAAGGDPKLLLGPAEGETDFHHVFVLPGDRGFLFHPHVDLEFDSIHLFTGTERREILRMEGKQLNSAAYVGGHIVFMRSPDNVGVWAVPFSLDDLAVTGEPFLVVADGDFPTVSRVGDLAFAPESQISMQIVCLNDNGLVTAEIGDPITGARDLAVSPDGRQAVVVIDDENAEIWTVDMTSGARQRFTFSKDPIDDLSWTADGTRITYAAGTTRAGLHQEIRAVNGTSTVAVGVRGKHPMLAHDGRTLVLAVWNDANDPSIGYVDIDDPDFAVTMIADTRYAEENPVLSPDDRFVAYETVESGQREVVVQSFPDGAGKWQISQDGGTSPFWSPTGEQLYFRSLSGRWLHVVDVSRDPVRFGAPRRLFQVSNHRSLSAMVDGGFAAMRVSTGERQGGYEVWLNWADNFAPGSAPD